MNPSTSSGQLGAGGAFFNCLLNPSLPSLSLSHSLFHFECLKKKISSAYGAESERTCSQMSPISASLKQHHHHPFQIVSTASVKESSSWRSHGGKEIVDSIPVFPRQQQRAPFQSLIRQTATPLSPFRPSQSRPGAKRMRRRRSLRAASRTYTSFLLLYLSFFCSVSFLRFFCVSSLVSPL